MLFLAKETLLSLSNIKTLNQIKFALCVKMCFFFIAGTQSYYGIFNISHPKGRDYSCSNW